MKGTKGGCKAGYRRRLSKTPRTHSEGLNPISSHAEAGVPRLGPAALAGGKRPAAPWDGGGELLLEGATTAAAAAPAAAAAASAEGRRGREDRAYAGAFPAPCTGAAVAGLPRTAAPGGTSREAEDGKEVCVARVH